MTAPAAAAAPTPHATLEIVYFCSSALMSELGQPTSPQPSFMALKSLLPITRSTAPAPRPTTPTPPSTHVMTGTVGSDVLTGTGTGAGGDANPDAMRVGR